MLNGSSEKHPDIINFPHKRWKGKDEQMPHWILTALNWEKVSISNSVVFQLKIHSYYKPRDIVWALFISFSNTFQFAVCTSSSNVFF